MQLIWGILKWTLLTLLSAVLLVVAINAFDETLRPEVKAALAPPAETVPPQDNLFYALLGFNSPSADLVQAGIAERRRLEQLPAATDAVVVGAELRRQRGEGVPGALRFQGDAKQLDQAGLTVGEVQAARQAGRIDGDAVVAANRALLERYRSLRRYGQSANYVRADAQAIAPISLGGVTQARRVWLLWVAGMASGKETDAAVLELRDDTLFWRRMLAQPQTPLIDKMILVSMVLRDFRSASELLHQGRLTASQRAVLAEAAGPLTLAERSMAGAFANETHVMAALMAAQARDGVRLFDHPSVADGEPMPDYLRRALNRTATYLFQPNALTNEHHRQMRRLAELDAQDCRNFPGDQQALQAEAEAEEPAWWRWAYNPTGKFMMAGAGSLLHRYTGRLCDLTGFQRLLALQIRLHDQGVTPQAPPAQIEQQVRRAGAAYADPYTGGPMLWEPGSKGLAFDAADDRNRKMLPWAL